MYMMYCKKHNKTKTAIQDHITGEAVRDFCSWCEHAQAFNFNCPELFVCINESLYKNWNPYKGNEFTCESCEAKFKCYTKVV